MSRFLFLAILLGGCGKADEALKALEGVKADVCGCKPTNDDCVREGLQKIADWHAKHDATEGARSQSAKATAHLDDITACQTDQAVAGIPLRHDCKPDDPSRWCKVGGWGGAKPVKPEALPFGKTLSGEALELELGMPSKLAATPATLAIGGTAEKPTANGEPIEAKGASWRWKHGETTVDLRHLDGAWMTLVRDSVTVTVSVFDE